MKWNEPDAERQNKSFIKTENRMVVVRGLGERGKGTVQLEFQNVLQDENVLS